MLPLVPSAYLLCSCKFEKCVHFQSHIPNFLPGAVHPTHTSSAVFSSTFPLTTIPKP